MPGAMSNAIDSIEVIERQAREAAHQYVDLNDACPWNFYSPQGQVFKKAFTQERSAMLMAEAKKRREGK
jgi:hypothetical protein